MKLFKFASVLVLLCGAAFAQLQCPNFPCTVQVTTAQCPSGLPCAVTITQTPAPAVSISPTSLTFPSTALSTDSPVQIVLVGNASVGALPLIWSIAGPGFTSGGVSTCKSGQITHGKCGISVKFHPTAAGSAAGTLTINAGTPSVTTVVNLTGTTPSNSTTITMGETNVLTKADSGNGNLLVSQQATLSRTATIQSLSFYATTVGGTLRLGVFDATGPNGGPGAQVAASAEITPVAGWNTAPVISPVLLQAGTYWLAYLPSSNTLGFVNGITSGVSGDYYTFAYGPLPATFSTSPSTTTSHWSFYATLSAGPVVTKTVQLTWNASTVPVGSICNTATPPQCNQAAASYNLYRKTGSGGLVKIGNVAGSVLTFTDAAVPSGAYIYAATAVDSAGDESIDSNTVTVTIP